MSVVYECIEKGVRTWLHFFVSENSHQIPTGPFYTGNNFWKQGGTDYRFSVVYVYVLSVKKS